MGVFLEVEEGKQKGSNSVRGSYPLLRDLQIRCLSMESFDRLLFLPQY